MCVVVNVVANLRERVQALKRLWRKKVSESSERYLGEGERESECVSVCVCVYVWLHVCVKMLRINIA